MVKKKICCVFLMGMLIGCKTQLVSKIHPFIIKVEELQPHEKRQNEPEVKLTFEVLPKHDMKVYFDYDALEFESYLSFREDKKLYGTINSVCDLKRNLERFVECHFLIENKQHDFRLFDNIRNYDFEMSRNLGYDGFVFEKDVQSLRKGESRVIGAYKNCVYDLQINENDDVIRLYYVLKPDAELTAKGVKPLIFRSNWFSVNISNEIRSKKPH